MLIIELNTVFTIFISFCWCIFLYAINSLSLNNSHKLNSSVQALWDWHSPIRSRQYYPFCFCARWTSTFLIHKPSSTLLHVLGSLKAILKVKDPMATRPYLFSDGQNICNRVVLVCTVNVYTPASLGRRPILRYQVLLLCPLNLQLPDS